MDYWELRKAVSQVVPRSTVLKELSETTGIREKGRKSGYKQFNIASGEMKSQERLLNEEEVNSFLEVSLRAQACPMPLNIDVWDGLTCPFACKYCYANAFRASLYTAFFDNSKTMGLRHCNADYYKRELDKLMVFRDKNPHDVSGEVRKAIAMEIPMRFGIRFEDFLYKERSAGVSLSLLEYLREVSYPLMINTKSSLVGEDDYVKVLSENKARTALHLTMISSDSVFLKRLEPGAPSFQKRIQACKNLVEAGVRVVARIEPYLVYMADSPDQIEGYCEHLKWAGVKNITFDTYSYSANNPGIRREFMLSGIDFDRLFLLGCDSQALGSLLLGKFMEEFRKRGFSCSTFDMGNASTNDQDICCEVGDWFQRGSGGDVGYNYGCTVMAARYIRSKKDKPTSWKSFERMVNRNGGFLSDALRDEVRRLWNGGGNTAYGFTWAQGLVPCGSDEDGLVWKYNKEYDFRYEEILKGVIG